MIAGFEALGACSVRDLAGHLGVAAESLYYHVKLLLAAGLIVESGTRPTERRQARLYRVVSRAFEVRIDGASSDYRAAYDEMAGALLRWAGRAHSAALEDASLRQSGPARQRSLMQFHARLDDDALAELNRRLEEVEGFVRENEDPTARPYAITLVVSPTGGAS